MLRRQARMAGCSRWLVRTTKGRSDQGGWLSIHCASGKVSFPNSASSATKTAPTPAAISLTSSGRLRQLIASRCELRNSKSVAPDRSKDENMVISLDAHSSAPSGVDAPV
ncbi:hypothetical protein J2R91_009237 [Bradyrhizobium japonicum]|nr:hypothetical protein [Bradyrhizobium japonicum]